MNTPGSPGTPVMPLPISQRQVETRNTCSLKDSYDRCGESMSGLTIQLHSCSASSIKTSTSQGYSTKAEKKKRRLLSFPLKNPRKTKNKTSSVLVKEAEYQDITAQWKSKQHCWLAHWFVLCKVKLKCCLSEEQEIWWNGNSQPASALLRRGWEKGCDPFGHLRSMFGQPHEHEITQHS